MIGLIIGDVDRAPSIHFRHSLCIFILRRLWRLLIFVEPKRYALTQR